MTFMEAEEYINRIPRFADSHTLKDSRSYLDTLGSPDDGMKIIHVAGTNGKGIGATSLVIENLAQGTWYFQMIAFNVDNIESPRTAIVSRAIL